MQISNSNRLLLLLLLIVALAGLLARFSDLERYFQANLALLNSAGWSMIRRTDSNHPETIFLATNSCPTSENDLKHTQANLETSGEPTEEVPCYALLQSRLACLQGQGDRALDWFDLARETCPRQEQIDDWAGALAWTASDKQEALAHWLQIKHSQTMLMHRAQQLIKTGKFEESQLLLEAALLESSWQAGAGNLAQAFENLGLTYQRQSNWSQAIEAYRESLSWDPKRLSTWILLAITYRNNHQWNEAKTAFQQAFELIPKTDARQRSIIFEQMGIMQQEQGHYNQAYFSLSEAFCLRKNEKDTTNRELSPLINRLEHLQRQLNGGQAITRNIISCPTQSK